MSAEGEEVDIQILNVDRHVGSALGCIHQHDRTRGVRLGGYLPDWDDCAEHIAHLGDCQQLRRLDEQFGQVIAIQVAARGNAYGFNACPTFLGDHLPRHEIRMVFHFSDENQVILVKIGTSPTCRHQVNRFGGSPRVDALGRFGSVNKRGYLFTGGIERRVGGNSQLIHATMNVAIDGAVVVHQRINHRLRFLTGGCRIEERERCRARLVQNGKIAFDDRGIEHEGCCPWHDR